MRVINFILVFLATWQAFAADVRIRIVDDLGEPLQGAKVTIAFGKYVNGTDDVHEGVTDVKGLFAAKGKAQTMIVVAADKANYYGARLRDLDKAKDHELQLILPRVLKPTALLALTPSLEEHTPGVRFPAVNEWVGFDFERGDWVSPHGSGVVSDILLRFGRKFQGYQQHVTDLEKATAFSKRIFAARKEEWTEEKFKLSSGKWDCHLEMKFPNEKEGIIEEKRFLKYSSLKMPHKAPNEGYDGQMRIDANNYSMMNLREDTGFFVRTRVKRDSQGNILSCHYGKLQGGIQIYHTGVLVFTYYFNPEANDRNLEFDPAKNLFPASRFGRSAKSP